MVQLGKTFAALVLFAAGAYADITQVQNDISSLSTQANTLSTDITNFSGDLSAALAIHEDAQKVIQTLTSTTSDVQAVGSLDDNDAQAILNSVNALVPSISSSLTGLVSKKSELEALPFSGTAINLVKMDLQSLHNGVTALSNAFVAAFPSDLQGAATAMEVTLSSDFESAISAFN